ncbi:DUF192 domain-containing protein [Phaeobacter sp.]|uniref:DUF192 domain-containing protein n=1 Tax=Phaeobacter sp. TaxID=1902409 RepID=UPI0025E922F6|nr:DUF192 domain-containing protein [Phaeobacter sp.]
MKPVWSRVKRSVVAGAGLLVLSLITPGAAAAETSCRPDFVDLRGTWGQARFQIELADTPALRSQGLMHRTALATTSGMLFVYEQPQRAAFWMKNTLIPLDMLFVDQSGVVRHIHENAIPGDLTPIEGGNDVLAVLEINGGLARQYGITVGTELRHDFFSDFGAIWPC